MGGLPNILHMVCSGNRNRDLFNCELSGLYTRSHAFWIWINRVHSVFVVQVDNNRRQDRDSQKWRDRGQGHRYNRKSAKFNQSGMVYF